MKELGRKNFTKTVIDYFDTSEIAFDYEKLIVTPELVRTEECYNNKVGGQTWGKGEKHPATIASLTGTHWNNGLNNPVHKQCKDGRNVFIGENNPQKLASKNGTHHWLNGKHPNSMNPPWRHTKSSDRSVKTWLHADIIYIVYVKNKAVGQYTLTKLCPKDLNLYIPTVRNILIKFRNGWIPLQDPSWVKFQQENISPNLNKEEQTKCSN